LKNELFNYELVCDENILNNHYSDLHSLLAYKINPKLAEISQKYYRRNVSRNTKVIESWLNEYDGARVRVLYTIDDRNFNETIVDWLYDLRDFLIDQKLDLNSYTRYLADIASIAIIRNPSLFFDIKELLEILGCNVKIYLPRKKKIQEKKVVNVLRNASAVFDTREKTSKVIIKVFRSGKPLPNVEAKIKIVVPTREGQKVYTSKLLTSKDGTIVIPVKKYSIISIKIGSQQKEIIVNNNEEIIEFNLKENKLKYIFILLGSLFAISSLLFYLILVK